ncbi:hypothetical protein IGB42_01724 [Andreprevotia sp. IGB-42]|uniref:TIGR02285 family protein n=1 Tax=Andreprevotia sp. IGB-42 TaxID=2497473 RepID=UPI001357B5B1|nr:TIGR02285 family protein [Andreprevotia sp. IGB-42]KAF0814044.1 hypothetical protein IGB42_01724 [Andreprevotia sp. IGB-42]
MKPHLVLALILLPALACAEPQREITWVLLNWPPVFILFDGQTPAAPNELGSGMGEQQLRMMAERLPQYRHRYVRSDPQRAFGEMRRGMSLCFYPALKTEDRRTYSYALPAAITTPLQLVVREDQRARIAPGPAGVSLPALLARNDLKGYVQKGRSYAQAVDTILDAPASQAKRITLPRVGHLQQLIDSGQVDYTLEYPYVIEYENKVARFHNDLVSVPIAELEEPVVWHVACTRNNWGKNLMRDLDPVLRELATNADWREISGQWLDPATQRLYHARFKAFYDWRQRVTLKELQP